MCLAYCEAIVCITFLSVVHNNALDSAPIFPPGESIRPTVIVFDPDKTVWPFYVAELKTPLYKKNKNVMLDRAYNQLKIYSQIPSLFDELHRTGYKLALISESPDNTTISELIEFFGLQEFLTYIEIYPGNKTDHFEALVKMEHHTRSEIDELLRGDLSDVEGFEDCDEPEDEVLVTEEVLAARLQDFDKIMRELDIHPDETQNTTENNEKEINETADARSNDDEGGTSNENVRQIRDAMAQILEEDIFPNETIPLLHRLTKKNKNQWIKQREIKRWKIMTEDDDFPEYNTDSVMGPPPQKVLYPKEYFNTFFDNDMMENIVEQTNLYSVHKKGDSINTSLAEMEQFIGMNLLGGMVKMPSYRMYWSSGTRYPPIADVMSRNRFDTIRSTLHLNDNANFLNGNDPSHDRLFKIRPFVDALKENMRQVDVEDTSVVDEITVPFKGRSQIRQYNPMKPHKWGVKIFALASVSGIVHDFEIYVGKGTLPNTELGISGDVVLRLVEVIPKNRNYKVFIDNWFNSHKLMCALKKEGLLALGTVRENRSGRCPFPSDKELVKKGRGFHDVKIDTDNKIVACKWVDNKVVCLLSTFSGVNPTDEVERWSASAGERILVPRPATVREYNASMGGVDLHDMLVELYRNSFRVNKPYLRIFYHMVDMCVVNAWLLYRRHLKQLEPETKPKSLVVFKAQVAEALIKSGEGKTKQKKRGRPSVDSPEVNASKKYKYSARPADEVRYDDVDHWPLPTDTKKRCKLCIQNYSTMKCSKCNLYLCLNKNRNCFIGYHRK